MSNDPLTAAVLGAALFFAAPSTAAAQTVLDSETASRAVEIANLSVKDHVVTGDIVNHTPHLVRDVEVLVQYHWLWSDEFHPGQNSPGEAAYIRLNADIRPGERVAFAYSPRTPLQSSKAGSFMPEASVAGFSVVVMPGDDVPGGHGGSRS